MSRTNQDISDRNSTVLQKAHSVMKANVYLDTSGNQPVVIKDYSNSPSWLRNSLCRFLLNRETRTLKKLSGIKGIPVYMGRMGKYAYRMQYINGSTPKTQELGASSGLLTQLAETVENMHMAGVTHNDLRPQNLILDIDSQLYIIDFGAAFHRPKTNNWLTRPAQLFFNYLTNTDKSKVARLKEEFRPEQLTAEDTRLIEKTRIARKTTRLWKKHVLPIISPGKHRKSN